MIEIYRIAQPLNHSIEKTKNGNNQRILVHWPLTTNDLENPNLDPKQIVIIHNNGKKLRQNDRDHTIANTYFQGHPDGHKTATITTIHKDLTEALQHIPPELRNGTTSYNNDAPRKKK